MELGDGAADSSRSFWTHSLCSRGVVYGLLIVMNKYPTLGCREASPFGLNLSLHTTPGKHFPGLVGS